MKVLDFLWKIGPIQIPFYMFLLSTKKTLSNPRPKYRINPKDHSYHSFLWLGILKQGSSYCQPKRCTRTREIPQALPYISASSLIPGKMGYPPGNCSISQQKRHVWVDDFPFPRWDMHSLVPWSLVKWPLSTWVLNGVKPLWPKINEFFVW